MATAKLSMVVPPLNFTIRVVYGDNAEVLSKFNAYVQRNLSIPEGVDRTKLTTGVVIDPDGRVRHVPTKVMNIDGQYYAQINSLTNSMYAVVWNPVEFGDVTTHWSKAAVNDMGSRLIIEGLGGANFSPDQEVTRAEFAAILVRGLGLVQAKEEGTVPFTDVNGSDWHHSAINTAYVYQLIDGYQDGTFQPTDKITREQAMVILTKAMILTGLHTNPSVVSSAEVLSSFRDASQVSPWAQAGTAESVKAGVISGRSEAALSPKANMTRAEAATIIQRLLQKSGLIE